MLIFQAGEKNRTVTSTKIYNASARSHAITIIRLDKSSKEVRRESSVSQRNSPTKSTRGDKFINKSLLYLVDLASSERVRKTKAVSVRLEEARKINYSLLMLSNCISALAASNFSYVNYRDSKLTRLLQESLGGNARTSLIVTISPSGVNVEETMSSLSFGQRAMRVHSNPVINKDMDYGILANKLQNDLDCLNDEYTKLKTMHDKLLESNSRERENSLLLKKQLSISNIVSSDNVESITKQLDEYYDEVIRKKEADFEVVLEKRDKILQENSERLRRLEEQNKQLKEKVDELIGDKIALEKTIIEFNVNRQESYQNMYSTNETKDTQTGPEIIDPQINELIASLSKRGKTVNSSLNLKDNNIVYKLEYFVLRFEKEIFKLNKENKDLREKLKGKEETLKNISYDIGSIDQKLKRQTSGQKLKNLIIDQVTTLELLKNEKIDLNVVSKPLELSFIGDVTAKQIKMDNQEIKLINFSIDQDESEEEDKDLKILEQNNEIMKLKATLKKRNKTLDDYEIMISKYEKIQKELLTTKNDLVIINRSIRESKLNHGDLTSYGINDSRSTNIRNQLTNRSVITELGNVNEKYKLEIQRLRTELELTKLIEIKLKRKLEECNIINNDLEKRCQVLKTSKEDEILRIKEKCKELLGKSTQPDKRIIRTLQDIFKRETEKFDTLQKDLDNIQTENKRNYASELFEEGLNIQNLNLSNFEQYLNKFNMMNFIIKFDEEVFSKTDIIQDKAITDPALQNFISITNTMLKKRTKLFWTTITALRAENSKIFFYSNITNNLIRNLLVAQCKGQEEDIESQKRRVIIS